VIRRLRCDHLQDDETAGIFDAIRSECGRLDLLVNCAWGGYEQMVEGGAFTGLRRSGSSHFIAGPA
jgi:dehydrogenase/reductase SDR family protein 1